MPPKSAARRPGARSQNPTVNIRSLYSAARPHHRGSGHGYRFGSADNETPVQSQTRLQSHWAAEGLQGPSSSSASNNTTATSAAQHHQNGGGSSSSSGPSDVFSYTLQEARARILASVTTTSSSSSSTTPSPSLSDTREAHRRRAVHIAFGTGQPDASQAEGRPSRGPASASLMNEDDGELMVSAVEFSLLCPYSRLPMQYPVRSRECRHVQCCDIDSWMVLMNKCKSLRDPTGPCPVCEQRVAVSTLEVDQWMLEVMASMPSGTHLVVLNADGSYVSGDASRERRKQDIMTEIIDCTQGDYTNYLGDVVEDEEEVVTVLAAPAVPTAPHNKRPRSITPPRQDEIVVVHSDVDKRSTPTPSVKQEMQISSQFLPSQASDDGVTVVRYVEGRPARVLPSQARLWVPHCMACRAAILKDEGGQLGDRCPQCHATNRDQWTLVRTFSPAATVRMELTPDDTLLLCGADKAAAYLYRAGFQRTRFTAEDFLPVHERSSGSQQPSLGVWSSSLALTRFDLDFLEACCARIAQGEDVDSIDMLPPLFRIPRRRKATDASQQTADFHRTGGGGGSSSAIAAFFSQGSRPQLSPVASWGT